MGEAKILGVSAVGWTGMTQHWWQWTLVGIILASTLIGSLYLVYSLVTLILKQLDKPPEESVPKGLSKRLAALSRSISRLVPARDARVKPTSFGVYLGSFDSPHTKAQTRLLAQWDLIILDPLRQGAREAAAETRDRDVVGRLDLEKALEKSDSVTAAVDKVASLVASTFKDTAFSGVLIAGWEKRFNLPVFREFATFLSSVGLDVYLETSPPDFLSDGKFLRMDAVAGVVVRNCSILSNGEKRDYFQMEKMQKTVKAFVAESCLRDFVVMAWETLDDNAYISNAVIKRSLQWSNFYSAITWIGTNSALTDAAVNVPIVEPFGAFEWLKQNKVMKIHDTWRANSKITENPRDQSASIFEPLYPLLSSLGGVLSSKVVGEPEGEEDARITLPSPPDWTSHFGRVGNPLSISPAGAEYHSLGCFPLGFDANPTAFAEVVQSQNRLRRLGLLHPVDTAKMLNIGTLLKRFHEKYMTQQWKHSPLAISSVKELATILSTNGAQIYLGLDSGFRKDAESKFWAVYQNDGDGYEFYVSKNAQGLAGIILHTYFSSRGFPRHECFQVELALAEWSANLHGTSALPRRLVQDVEMLSPSERLLLLQHLKLSDEDDATVLKIRAYTERQLLDRPSLAQLKELNTVGYLNGTVPVEDLVKARIAWYREQGCLHPDVSKSIALFREVEFRLAQILQYHDEDKLNQITNTLDSVVKKGNIDAYVDIIALAMFCAARKFAFDEVYCEVTDRNPLFNDQSDQAAAFAESFALGSRCESYFDVSPSVFGKLLSDRYRQYYQKHQPPLWLNGAPELASAYAAAQIDVDPDEVVKPLPEYQRFTFLSVFAIPALVDIVLLTTTGRGLYLSAFMTQTEQESATTALMIALLLSGAIGTWISCGGSYYLISMAFSAMNMFVLTRLIAGLAVTVAGGIIGLAVIGAIRGFHAGIIFCLYLIALTAYLSCFAALASFQFPGSSFQSGRIIIIFCIPFLFVSPIVTMFVGHSDAAIYLTTMFIFIVLLFFGLRHTGSKWVTWYQGLRRTTDGEVKKWFVATKAFGDEEVFNGMTDPAALKLARSGLQEAVLMEVNRGYFTKATTDTLVAELARDWSATHFLVDWYCRYSDTKKPIPYSSGWNIQTKVALDTLQAAQKGIRLHNAFIHWRNAGDEVGCGILYFLVALLDKWIDLVSGVKLVGLSGALTETFRMAVGFGLAYYLIGAVLVDTNAQHLHALASKQRPSPINSSEDIRQAQKRDARVKRNLYWKTLGKFLLWHVWALAFTASLVWALQSSKDAMLMFSAYVLAYTGLLWYQYTKIFSGPHALRPLLTAVAIGLPTGIFMKKLVPQFLYSSVIALGVATWTAAILSLWTAKIGMPDRIENPVEMGKIFHAYTAPWRDQEWSQQELQASFDDLCSLPKETRFKLDPRVHPGVEVRAILSAFKEDSRSLQAFPDASHLVNWSMEAWGNGNVTVEMVPLNRMISGIRAVSCASDGRIQILVGAGRGTERTFDVSSNCQIVAETLLHSVAEHLLGIPHDHAILAESLISNDITQSVKFQLREETDSAIVTRFAKRQLLKQLCLGFNCDTDWDALPRDIRCILLQRCLGEDTRISDHQWDWLQSTLCESQMDTKDLGTYIARCNLGASMSVNIHNYALVSCESFSGQENQTDAPTSSKIKLSFFKAPFSWSYHTLGKAVKFFVIAVVADPEFQREFDYVMSKQITLIRVPVTFFANVVWMYGKLAQNFVLPIFLFHGRKNVKKLWKASKGMTISIKRKKMVIQSLEGTFTGFTRKEANGGFKLYQYTGNHDKEPEGTAALRYVSTFSKQMQLVVREQYNGPTLINEYHYDYQTPNKSRTRLSKWNNPKIPLGRRCVRGQNHLQSVQYNHKGLIESGSHMKDGNLVRFKYHYRKNARFGNELLRAEFVLSHISCTVSWCAPPRRHPEKVDRWIPHSKITEATFVQGPDVYESRWLYDHKFHPTIMTTLNGEKVVTPPMIEHDYLAVLSKPGDCSFTTDNPILSIDSLNSNFIARGLGFSKQRLPISTGRARSQLWKEWKDSFDFDGVIVRWLDEKLMRKDKVLKTYWRSRDRGSLAKAKAYLDLRADAIMASADLDDSISSWTPLALKISDLYNFGPGGDAVVHTRSKEFQFDNEKTLHIMAADNGTWPNEGGGVSACRRDMINSLRTIKWHMICESATDFGIPKHQTEQNIQSLKVIPLWGLDFLTPTHGLFQNRLDSEVESMTRDASYVDIQRNFIPTLTALVKGARAISLSSADVQQATRALVNLNTYFEDSRHWSQVWTSDTVKNSWRQLWLTNDMPNTKPCSEWFETELPTVGHLETALELWYRYLFIFSIPIPEKIPSVFQASHHSVSASYGVVCKLQRKCTLQIWDHAIAWRETNLCLSSALCKLPPFVRNSLLGLMRMTSVLILHHADIILPCADFFNPAWEVEIGTCQGTLEHRNTFRRKIDPVVNGITDMHKFAPVKEIKAKKPTVTMLSHVWFAKDIKTAILAADIIVNEWGFSEYRLDIYGALDKAPTYSTECQEILASKSLRENCTLRGTADPTSVLENTWLFLNSSISEGLPLALGEAALTGAPVVCTDVGASLRVLSDPDDFSRFSAVVAPNDARALARAQINMLGMLDEWAKFANDTEPAPILTTHPTPADVAKITARMYSKSEFRRELGMKTRAIVQKSFSGDRYLREHEQMLWVGKYRKLMANRIYPETEDFSEVEKAIHAPLDEKILSLPRRILPSWGGSSSFRSSQRSSFRDSMGGNSTLMLDSHTRDRRDVKSFTSRSSFTTRAESMMLRPDSYAQRPGSELRPPGAWPVFAPRDSLQSKSDLKKLIKRGLDKDGGERGRSKLYRSSDISSLAPTERMNLSAF